MVLVTLGALVVAETGHAGLTRPEQRLLRVVNDVRSDYRAGRTQVGSTLQSPAHRWARYLRVNDAFYHGALRARTAENIGWVTCRQGWARALVRMWLNSASHRPHLLDRSAERIGVGVNTGRWSGYGCVRMAVTRFR